MSGPIGPSNRGRRGATGAAGAAGATGPASTIASPPHVRPTDSSAGATSPEQIFWRAPAAHTTVSINFLPRGSLTGDNIDYASFVAKRYNSSNVLQDTWTKTTQLTDGGGMTNNQPWPVLSGTSTAGAAGDYYTLTVGKSGAGKSVPAGNTQVGYQPG